MGFYVSPEYMETIHYYYFSIGVFSFMCAVIFSFSAVYSIAFTLLYIGLSAFAWYISWVMQKKMREFVIPNSLRFASEHVAFTFLVGGMTLGLWYFNALNEESLISSILYVNYFVFFMAVAWYLAMRFGFVKTVFDIYDSSIMERAKKLIIKTREDRKDIFTRILISDNSIKNYKTGSNPEVDELLLNVWREKKTPKVLRRIAEIEITLCNSTVDRLKKWISETSSRSAISPRERESVTRYTQAIDEYAKALMEYEKYVINMLPAD